MMYYKLGCVMLLAFLVINTSQNDFVCLNDEDPNIPESHLPYYFNRNFDHFRRCCSGNNITSICKQNPIGKACWGYEVDCNKTNSFPRPDCPSSSNGWANTKKEQLNIFYSQGDFGFVRDQRNQLFYVCEPTHESDSSLECTNHLQFCRGRHILVNFSSLLYQREPSRYNMDVLREGDIGGFCRLYEARLKEECDHLSALQSWGPELRNFKALKKPLSSMSCDMTVEIPTFIMKIDAAVNMYHHFCDFINLYMSQHVNSSNYQIFSTNIQIIIWETYEYDSVFSEVFQAFTNRPIWTLTRLKGKTVCFDNIVFPLLPRMIFGLYYNTPLITGCQKSGLFHAFQDHILHRLKVPRYEVPNTGFNITFLSRDTQYRKVLNERQLIHAISNIPEYNVRKVVYSKNLPFSKQLEITQHSDVFISMHGAGLTHLLFLPDWAVVFELYNCDDEFCYFDLARLRGVKYITWRDKSKIFPQDQGHHPDGMAHAKFTNYRFDVTEFVSLVDEAVKYVEKTRPAYKVYNLTHLHDEL